MLGGMARLAQVVASGLPHHVTQRGNRRQQTFFGDADYQAYKELVAKHCGKAGVAVWAYCLMPKQVHLILVPGAPEGLGDAHRRYTRRINNRQGWRGYLWHGRFAPFPLDAAHLHATAGRRRRPPASVPQSCWATPSTSWTAPGPATGRDRSERRFN